MAGAGPSGRMKIALGISLALNVFFIGLTGGSLFHEKPERRNDAPNSFLETLSDERKAEVKAHFSKLREARRASRGETRAAWGQVREAMIADPFERSALEAAMDAVIDTRTEQSRERYGQMIDFVAEMSDAERIAFSNAMRERWRKRRGPGRGGDED